ncbi:MAG TPA: hypothetical protein VJT84_04405 [Gaiellaceae bacterium]|nr:hypothetical protein [Gaiellaceae bacterium]
MSFAVAPGRGSRLLLAHCASLTGGRPQAADRLRQQLGTERSERLVAALARQGAERRRRGWSSP